MNAAQAVSTENHGKAFLQHEAVGPGRTVFNIKALGIFDKLTTIFPRRVYVIVLRRDMRTKMPTNFGDKRYDPDLHLAICQI